MVTTYVGNNSGGGTGTPTNITAGDGIVVSGSDPNYTIAVDPTISDLAPFTSSDASIDIVATNPGFDFRVAGGTGGTLPTFQSVDNSIIIATDPSGTIINFSQNPALATTVESIDPRIEVSQPGTNTWRLALRATGLNALHFPPEIVMMDAIEKNVLQVYTEILPDDGSISATIWSPLTDAGDSNLRLKYIHALESVRRISLTFTIRRDTSATQDIEVGVSIQYSQDGGLTFNAMQGTTQFQTATVGFHTVHAEANFRFQNGDIVFPQISGIGSGSGQNAVISSISFAIA